MKTEEAKGTLFLVVGGIGAIVAIYYIVKLMNGIGNAVGTVVDTVGDVTDDFGITTSDLAQSIKDIPCLKPTFFNGVTGSTPPPTTTFHTVYNLTKDIYDAKTGAVYTNDAKILAVFKKMKSKNEVSFLSRMFLVRYDKDLVDFFYSPMTNDYLVQIVNFVNALPKT